jgi:hypothetical protein
LSQQILDQPIAGKFKPSNKNLHMLGAMQTIETPMRCYQPEETVDYCIVGVGSAGGVLSQRLARAGFKVVGLEAGPFWDTEKDWVSDEAGSHKLYWTEPRVTGGEDPLALGANNSGSAAGLFTGPVSPLGFTRRTLKFTPRTALARTGRSPMPISSRIMNCWNWRCLLPGLPTIPGETHMATPLDHTRWAVSAMC